VLDRGAVAVLELERREDHLLARYLEDPPQHLLDSIGAPPPDSAGQQAWRDQARHLERARTTDVTLDQAVRGPGGERLPTDGPPEPKDLALRPRDELGHNDLATDRASDDWRSALEP
jgi:hypothetical protein